jgi:hypothetical protein
MTAKITQNFVLGVLFTTLYYVELVGDIGFVSISSAGTSRVIGLESQIDNSLGGCGFYFAYSRGFHVV